MSKKVLIGKVISAFGIKGEVKILSYCQDPIQIENYPLFFADDRKISLKISNKNKTVIGHTSSGEAILIAKIDNINDRNQSENLRGYDIFTDRENFDKLAENEFYYVDLIGLEVIDMNSKRLGVVSNVFDFGAGTMIEIAFDEKRSLENFPFKNEIFPEVNIKNGFIKFEMPEIIEKS